MRKTVFILAAFLLSTQQALACSVCFFGDPTAKANVALRQSIVTLLIILVILLALLSKFFISVAKRSKDMTEN